MATDPRPDESECQPERKFGELIGLTEQELRRELQIGFDQCAVGEEDDWDVDEILKEAHRRWDRTHGSR